MLGSLLTTDEAARARLTGRLAAFLFLASGVLALVNVPLPGPPDINRMGEYVVAVCAMALGYVTWRIDWGGHSAWWQLLLGAPAFLLISLGNLFGGSQPPYVYGVFYVVVFMWIGLALPRWTSAAVAPVALLSYVTPILYLPGDVGYGVSTAAITIPICVLVGETLAWGLTRLGRTEARLVRSQEDYKQAFQSTRQYAEAYQRQMEVTERIRSGDRIRDTFLQAVSHDLRSPLTAILGSARTLEQGGLSDDERADLLRRISFSARRLDRMLSDLLDIDRLQRGIVSPERRPTDVRGLIERPIDEAGLREHREIEVSVEGEPLMADVDPAKVERIVENLVSNAVKHSPGGTIHVRASAERDGLALQVDDEGPGVPDELKAVVFQPFRRGPGTELLPGVGLGLALVARFAELHGGRAWVEDRPGGGASFRVFLPATVVAGAKPEAEAAGVGPAGNGEQLEGLTDTALGEAPTAKAPVETEH
jgi:signal transduction histidine kinase